MGYGYIIEPPPRTARTAIVGSARQERPETESVATWHNRFERMVDLLRGSRPVAEQVEYPSNGRAAVFHGEHLAIQTTDGMLADESFLDGRRREFAGVGQQNPRRPGAEVDVARSVTISEIIDAVTDYYDVRLTDLQSKKRSQSITLPRQICMFLARSLTRHSLEEIGGHLRGGRITGS